MSECEGCDVEKPLCPGTVSLRGQREPGLWPLDSRVMSKRKEENWGESGLVKRGLWCLPAQGCGRSQVETVIISRSPVSDPWIFRDQLPREQAKVPLFPHLSAKGQSSWASTPVWSEFAQVSFRISELVSQMPSELWTNFQPRGFLKGCVSVTADQRRFFFFSRVRSLRSASHFV